MNRSPALLDTVALLHPVPSCGLAAGQVGTVVEELDGATVEVEFANLQGETLAMLPVAKRDLLVLVHDPPQLAA